MKQNKLLKRGKITNLGRYFEEFNTEFDKYDFVKIFSGKYHTFGMKNDGSIWATGDNSCGQLGLGETVEKTIDIYTKVDMENVKDIICGDSFSLIIKNTI